MSKPKKISGKKIMKILHKHGWKYYHHKGSHMVFRKDDKYVHVPVKEKVVRPRIIKHIEKKTGVVLI